MRIKGYLLFLAFFFFIIYNDAILSQEKETARTTSLTAYELVNIAVGNIEKNNKLKNELISFKRIYIENELDRSGHHKSVLAKRTTYHGKAYPENLREDENNTGLSINLNGIILQSYDYVFVTTLSLKDQSALNGHEFVCDCYTIRFTPKRSLPDVAKIAPVNASLTEIGIHEAAMRMDGIIYIDKRHLFIRMHSGKLSNAFSKYGSAIKATKASIITKQELRPDLDNIIVITSGEIMYQVKKAWGLLGFETRKREWKYSNYRLNPMLDAAQ
jgi:hypothetical protein